MSAAENSSSGRKRPPEGDDDGGGKQPALADAAVASDDGDVCWLCLDAVHESGAPLRRDCSCRGGSGFAHLPCIVEYAKDWSQKNERPDFAKCADKWRRCHNCKQIYMGDLGCDLRNEFVSFVKDKYAGDRMKNMIALYSKLAMLESLEEIKDTSLKILSLMVQSRGGGTPIPETIEFEAGVYTILGNAYLRQGAKENIGTAVEYLEKSLVLNRNHMPTSGEISQIEVELAEAKAKYNGAAFVANEHLLQSMKKGYNDDVKKYGREAIIAINAGLKFASHLIKAGHWIEAERLMTEVAATSQLAHGADHKRTKAAVRHLSKCKQRRVRFRTPQGIKEYQALRYEDEGRKLVVQGPIATPRRVQDENTITVLSDAICNMPKGTPLVCNGLQGQTSLNGKIGEMRGFDEANGCPLIRFEEKKLGEHPIQMKFLRILFELPEEGP